MTWAGTVLSVGGTVLSLKWRYEGNSAFSYNKCVSSFLKKTPMKVEEREGGLVLTLLEKDLARAQAEGAPRPASPWAALAPSPPRAAAGGRGLPGPAPSPGGSSPSPPSCCWWPP